MLALVFLITLMNFKNYIELKYMKSYFFTTVNHLQAFIKHIHKLLLINIKIIDLLLKPLFKITSYLLNI